MMAMITHRGSPSRFCILYRLLIFLLISRLQSDFGMGVVVEMWRRYSFRSSWLAEEILGVAGSCGFRSWLAGDTCPSILRIGEPRMTTASRRANRNEVPINGPIVARFGSLGTRCWWLLFRLLKSCYETWLFCSGSLRSRLKMRGYVSAR